MKFFDSKVHDAVEMVLRNYPETRDNDRLLLMTVMNVVYHCYTYEDGCSPYVPTTESIRRARQKIQSENIELASSRRIQKLRIEETSKYINYNNYGLMSKD